MCPRLVRLADAFGQLSLDVNAIGCDTRRPDPTNRRAVVVLPERRLVLPSMATTSSFNTGATEVTQRRKAEENCAGSENKQPFLIAVQTDENLEHPTFAVIEPVRAFDNASLKDWIERRLAPECEVYSDGLACFRRLEEAGHAHTTVVTGGGRAATQAKSARWLK